MKITSLILGAALLCFGFAPGCILDGNKTVSGKGTITFIGVEGGFFGIITDDGRHFDPISLPASFKKDGLWVKFKGALVDGADYHMWGEVITLANIQRL